MAQQLVNGFGFKVNRALIKVAENERGSKGILPRAGGHSVGQRAECLLGSDQRAGVRAHGPQQALSVSEQLYRNNARAFRRGCHGQAGRGERASAGGGQPARSGDRPDEPGVRRAAAEEHDQHQLEGDLESASIEAVDSFPEPDEDKLPSLQEAVAIAQKNRPEISIADGNIKSQQDVMPFLDNALLPNVNAFALINSSGLYNYFGTCLCR